MLVAGRTPRAAFSLHMGQKSLRHVPPFDLALILHSQNFEKNFVCILMQTFGSQMCPESWHLHRRPRRQLSYTKLDPAIWRNLS